MVGWSPAAGPMAMTAADWRKFQKPSLVQLGGDAEQVPGAFDPVKALRPSGYAPQVKRRLGIQGAWRMK